MGNNESYLDVLDPNSTARSVIHTGFFIEHKQCKKKFQRNFPEKKKEKRFG